MIVEWIHPAIVLIGSLFAGLWLRAVFMPRLAKWASQTQWDGDDVIVRALRGSIVLWSLMAGAYFALKFSPLPPHQMEATSQILQAVWIFSVTWVAAEVGSRLVSSNASRWGIALPMTSVTENVTRLLVLTLGMLMILDTLGVRIGSVLAALGIGSLAVALGLQDTLSNLFAGVYVSMSRSIRVGDYIKLGSGEEGYVEDIDWRSTNIRMLPGNLLVVPNSKLSQALITNFYLPSKDLAVGVDVTVAYDSDLEKVERVTLEVARDIMKSVPGGIPEADPSVRFHTFGEAGIGFSVGMRGKEYTDQYLIKHEFIKQLHRRYAAEGITIPFPLKTVYVVPGGAAAGGAAT